MLDGGCNMALGDLSLVGMLKTKMRWHQARQQLLAENVANADTPGFRPRELSPMAAAQGSKPLAPIAVAFTHAGHFATSPSAPGQDSFASQTQDGWETSPSGNSVVLEEEMMKVSENQFDYQLASTIYSRSLGLLRSAMGRQA